MGLATTVIETAGNTDFVQVGDTYRLCDHGTTTGPALKFQGADVVAGQFEAWTPLGVEATSGGYEVVWKYGAADQYTGWITDSNGNYISSLAVVPGTNPNLQVYETRFQQDLNGDGTIGPAAKTVVEALGATSLTKVGNEYFLLDSGGIGPALKFQGADVVAGQFEAWTPLGVEATSGGYEVVWKYGAADQYTGWITDSNGNYVSSLAVVPGTNPNLQVYEARFQQDLNGDGTIGPAAKTVVEALGATSLTKVGNEYFLLDSGGIGPALKFQGADVVAGQFGAWIPLGAEATSGGYEVAWKYGAADQYTVWSTDSNGDYVSNIVPVGPGTSSSLESIETSFQQDLNDDGTMGLATTVIETAGNTDFVQVGDTYRLCDHGTTTGPALKFQGADVVAGQFEAWTPLGVEATSGGYEVVWKYGAADQYTGWITDSNGNYISSLAVVPGTNPNLQVYETRFQQDLNGDGTIGPAAKTVVEALGATSLTKVGNEYFLLDSGGIGPALKFQGADVVAGQFEAWTPLGVEATSGGYEVAWKYGAADQYTVWSTDSNGDYVSNIVPVGPGTSSSLESIETSFQQDLNDDGGIGSPTIAEGRSFEIISAYAGDVVFAGSTGTLKLDHSSDFAGTVAGMSGQDSIDFADIDFAAVHQPIYSGTSSGGVLAVTDGTHSANIALLGNYLASTFVTSNDGYGGTTIADPILIASQQGLALTQPQHA